MSKETFKEAMERSFYNYQEKYGEGDDTCFESVWNVRLHPSHFWSEGYHRTRDGEEIILSEMITRHLENTIRFFEKRGYDVSPLQEELNSRYELRK